MNLARNPRLIPANDNLPLESLDPVPQYIGVKVNDRVPFLVFDSEIEAEAYVAEVNEFWRYSVCTKVYLKEV